MLRTHCIIHRENLASKKLSPDLKNVLTNAVKIVNAIRSRHLNSRLFQALCESMDAQHNHLLYAEVRWLSRGRVLSRPFELREETKLPISSIFIRRDEVVQACVLGRYIWPFEQA